ncbi:FAD-binding oxidoreductase [Actinomadura verrucosospora]|uniref:Mitomycin radical oxidase n=1 Tax=Actinomadura verrucosospora TaxID=46165 RepID=A0A7D3VWQ1_ACTVE|nr:FAD-binding oxidoreductase [Actinomadura verrucosospora]QKG24578.1 Mitomycin radical oxidase [Actinomadura verrucosospora]
MATSEGARPVSLDGDDIRELAAEVAGPVSAPTGAGYADACATVNLLTPVRPAVAVGATGADDVRAAVRFAARRDLPVAVLSTGHQVVRPAEGAVLINMSRMDAVRVDPHRGTARVEGGARWRGTLDAAAAHGLAPVSGGSSTVGVAGYHLGGGASPIMGRLHGYAADHVAAIEVVSAAGEAHRVTASAEPDLFWALRGGGGNFGVVTALEFALFPVETFYGGGLFFAGRHAAEVLHAWRDWVVGLPVEMSSSVAFLRMPSQPAVPEPLRGRFATHLRFSSLGTKEEAERALEPMRRIAPTIMESFAELPYRQATSVFFEPPIPLPWVERARMLRDFPAEAADALLAAAGPDSGSALGLVELRRLGGAMTGPPAVPSAVPGRDAGWSLLGFGGDKDRIPLLREQVTGLVEAVAPWTHAELMPNLLGAWERTTPQTLRAMYGPERFDRLAAIKGRYDPRNLFRMNHNIPPA